MFQKLFLEDLIEKMCIFRLMGYYNSENFTLAYLAISPMQPPEHLVLEKWGGGVNS